MELLVLLQTLKQMLKMLKRNIEQSVNYIINGLQRLQLMDGFTLEIKDKLINK